MRSSPRRSAVAPVATLAIILACSVECRAADPMATIPSQVAVAVYVQEWGQVLWGLVTTQTGTMPSSWGQPVLNPDGSVTQTFSAADGTVAVLTAFRDGSARIDTVLPDGTTQTLWQSVPSFDGVSVTTIVWHLASSDGLVVDYTSVMDDRGTVFDNSDDTVLLFGSAVLPGGLTQTFTALTAAGRTDLQSTQSDGSTFALSVPLDAPRLTSPDFSQAVYGLYTDPSVTLEFVLTSTPTHRSRWAALVNDLGDGLTGTFSLNQDFSGVGQVEVSGTLVALVSWTQDGEIEAYGLTGQNVQMGPAGAALDFLQYRWQTLTALLAPGQGASELSEGPRRPPRIPRPRLARPHSPRTP